jgi:glycosyltransferase involved in cell wall biosynthesis
MRAAYFAFLASDPDTLTGLASYTFSLLRACEQESDRELVLITTWTPEAVQKHAALTRTKIVQIKQSKLPLLAPLIRGWRAAVCFRKLRSTTREVLLSTIPQGAVGLDIRQVLVVHDMYMMVPGRYRWYQRAFFLAFFGALTRRASAIITVSKCTLADLLAWRGSLAAKSVVIHEAGKFPLDATAFNPSASHGLFVANIEKNKNVECLLDALDALGADAPVVKWVGRDRSGAVQSWRSAHDPLRTFLEEGVVDEARLRALYASAKFLVVTSTIEGFCLPVLEAQALGVPVLASDIPVLREVGGEGALFFPPTNSDALADLLRTLGSLSEREILALSSRASENAARFSWATAATKTLELMDTIYVAA